MPYTISRQHQWPSGDCVVEVSVGTMDYTNPDALVCKYPRDGEGKTVSDPVLAVEFAIAVCDSWRMDGQPDAQVGVGATGGMTMPFDPCTYDEARAWAEKQLAKLPRCARCDGVLDETSYTNEYRDGEKFCREFCAEEAESEARRAVLDGCGICDGCLTAAYDMVGADPYSQITLCTELGADIEDHLCDATEEPDLGIKCTCACQRR